MNTRNLLLVGAVVGLLGGCEDANVSDVRAVEAFPEGKVLTVDARDYVANVGKKLTDYVMVGFKCTVNYIRSHETNAILPKKCVPENTQVVVKYNLIHETAKYDAIHFGTALIPMQSNTD